MRIRDVMTKNPITVEGDTLILDALRIMKEHNIRRLPIVEKGKLVGIVTLQDLNEAAPPPDTSTKSHEFHSILSKMEVKEIMKRNPVTLGPDTPFEEALRIGQKKKISSFVVVENGKLIGIATESDIVRFLSHVLGLGEEGSRITIEDLRGKFGELEQIISIVDKNRTVVLSMLSQQVPDKKDWMVVLHLKTRDPEPIVNDLRNRGFNVTYVALSKIVGD